MATSFATLRKALAPRWLTEGEGGLIGYSLDLVKDAYAERLRWGLLARFPQNSPTTTGPADALAALGRDRRVIRGINETLASYALRLLRWLDDRKQAGNAFALMQKLAEYTGPLPRFRTVDSRGNWYTRNPDGTTSYALNRANWDWDGRPTDTISGKARWSRFWVIIYPNGLWTEGKNWGDTARPGWGTDVVTWGSTATADEVATIRALIADWKPANARCVNVILAFDNASFDPTEAVSDPGMPNGLWEHWSRNVGGVQVPARLSTARYWDGVV